MTDGLETVEPAYGRASLADVLPGALAALGIEAPDPIGMATSLDGARRIAVLLVDGLGHHQLPLAARHSPALADLINGGSARALTTGFPSTTPTSLASLGTGAPPGSHGLVGFTLYVPGADRVLNLLDWRDEPDPLRWQPLPTQFDRAAAAGVTTSVVARPEFRDGGLTTAVNRGGTYVGASDVDSLAAQMLARLRAGTPPVLVHGYHPDVDRAGHMSGVDSPEWRDAIVALDRLLTSLVEGLPPDGALVVTADHGQLNVAEDDRTDMDADARLGDGVHLVAGEPRVRYLHVLPGAAADVAAAWREVLGPRARVMPRDQAVAEGWFGPVPEEHLQRVGDVVVVCQGRHVVLSSRRDKPLTAAFVAFHGAATALEMMIPLLVVRGRG